MSHIQSERMQQISFRLKDYSQPAKPNIIIESGIGDMPFYNKHNMVIYFYLKDEKDFKKAQAVVDYLNEHINGLSIIHKED